MNDSVCRRAKRHGSRDDFVTAVDAGRQHADVQGGGTGVDARHPALLDTAEACKLLFELPNLGTSTKPA